MSSPANFVNLTGRQFARLTVIARAPLTKNWRTKWLCKCACGNQTTVDAYHLKHGQIKSCGCLAKELTAMRSITHGETVGRKISTEYLCWESMLRRCSDSGRKQWGNYGGRGIKVCQRWRQSFQNFLMDMGRKPGKEFSIERINNDGDYEPSNCKWATPVEQVRNRRPRATWKFRSPPWTHPTSHTRLSS